MEAKNIAIEDDPKAGEDMCKEIKDKSKDVVEATGDHVKED